MIRRNPLRWPLCFLVAFALVGPVVYLAYRAVGAEPPRAVPITSHALWLAHNDARRAAGLPELRAVGVLMYAAQDQADYLARTGTLTHTRPSGYSLGQRLQDYGVVGAGGENIAAGFADVDSLMKAWNSSPGHRANIVGSYSLVGFGIAGDKQVVVFARPP
jgi:uncharacterized protein YkwD